MQKLVKAFVILSKTGKRPKMIRKGWSVINAELSIRSLIH